MAKVVARHLARSKLSPLVLAFSLIAAVPAQAELSATELAVMKNTYSTLNRAPESALRQAGQIGDPIAEAMITWLYLQRPDNVAGFNDYATFLREHPTWPRRQILATEAERRLGPQENGQTVITFFKDNAPQTVKGLDAYAGALKAADQDEAARTAIRAFWRSATLTVSEQTDVLQRYRAQLTAADLHARVDRIIIGNLGASDVASRRVLANAIPLGNAHRAANEARLAMIEAMRSTARNDVTSTQIARMDLLARQVPEEGHADTGFIYDYARWLEYSDQPKKAGEVLLARPDHPHGDTAYAFKIRDIVARSLAEHGYVNEAYKVASEHGLKPSDDQSYRDAEWLAGWIALRFVGDQEKAWGHFQKQFNASTAIISRARGAYWLGRTAQESGKNDIANQWYEVAAKAGPSTFYGQAAALARYGEVKIETPVTPDPDSAEKHAFDQNPLIQAARIAHQMGQPDLVKSFMLAMANSVQSQGDATLTIKLSGRIGGNDVAAFAAKRVGALGYTVGREGYPTLRSTPSSPEQALIYAIIRQESTFDSQARSPAGALGLMQLMPKTAEKQARAMKIRHTAAMLQSNPAHNMRLGSAYLQHLLDLFGGSYVLAAAGYNAGPGRPQEWQNRFGTIGQPLAYSVARREQRREPELWNTIDWIEMIPFTETRNYVMRVNEAVPVYRSILADDRPVALRLSHLTPRQ